MSPSEVESVDSKHYVVTAYRCHLDCDQPELSGDAQHSALEVFHPPFPDFHPYVERYLDEVQTRIVTVRIHTAAPDYL